MFLICCPEIAVKITYHNRNPWMDKSLKQDIARREKLLKIKTKDPSEENVSLFKKCRNRVIALQRKAEMDYQREQLSLNTHDLRKSWKVLRQILGLKAGKQNCTNFEFIIHGNVVNDTREVATHFNNYFVNIGKSLSDKIQSDIDPLTYVVSNEHNLVLPIIQEQEVRNIIMSLKNTASGYDCIAGSVMKQCVDNYVTPLTHIINLSIAQGYFPDEWKLAKVIPIFKDGDPQDIQNYRPISVLPFLSKVFEKIISYYIIEFLDLHDVLYDKQFGLRQCHSTSHAVITLVEKITHALDRGKIVGGVFIDFKKAYDTVSHDILLQKLEAYGIKNNIYELIKSYLSNRKQFVQYSDGKSDVKDVLHGVPQGSILGPLFYIIYANDFSRASSLLFTIMFADDTSVFIEGQSYENVYKVVNEELKKCDNWIKANKLTLNVKKTHFMIFHRSRMKPVNAQISLRNENIKQTNSIKFLGIIVDNKLNWHEHIIYIKNKVSRAIGIIYKARKYANKQTVKQMYYTFVFPYLIYCCEIWGNTSQTHLDSLIKCQKKIVRVMTFSLYDAHSKPLFEQLHILDLKKLIIHRIALMMYKHSVHLLPVPVSNLFIKNSSIHGYNTRSCNLLHTKVGSSEVTYTNFSYHGVHIWNIIVQNIPPSISYNSFKHLSKIFIQKNDIHYRLRS